MHGATGYGNMEYFDLKYIVYPIIIQDQKNQASYLDPPHKGYENILVKYASKAQEQRTQQGKNDDGLESILSGKKDLLRSKIDLLLVQLGQRKKINQNVLYRIDKDDCHIQDLVFYMGPRRYYITRERINLEKMRFDLYKQRRMEEVSYFRDTALLNNELKDTLLEYQKELQNDSIMSGINKEVNLMD